MSILNKIKSFLNLKNISPKTKLDEKVFVKIYDNLSIEQFALQAVNVAYAVQDPKKFASKLANLPNFKLFANSQDNPLTAKYNLKAVASIDVTNKTINIAVAGTDPFSIMDLWDDVKLTFGRVPNKIFSIKAFIEDVINKLNASGLNPDEFKFITSGHSLGAVVADLAAVELNSRNLTVSKSITFDSPGSKKAIESAIAQKLLTGEVDFIKLIYDTDFEVINNLPNAINGATPQFGMVQLLIPAPSDVNTCMPLGHIKTTGHLLSNFEGNEARPKTIKILSNGQNTYSKVTLDGEAHPELNALKYAPSSPNCEIEVMWPGKLLQDPELGSLMDSMIVLPNVKCFNPHDIAFAMHEYNVDLSGFAITA